MKVKKDNTVQVSRKETKDIGSSSSHHPSAWKNVDALSDRAKMVITIVMFALIFLSELIDMNAYLKAFIYEFGGLTITLMVFLLFCDILEDLRNPYY